MSLQRIGDDTPGAEGPPPPQVSPRTTGTTASRALTKQPDGLANGLLGAHIPGG
jgi:hypothetical protein